jgi:hypothetical protein
MVKALFGDWLAMTKPHSVHLTRKKEINPFEDTEPLEYLSKKQDVRSDPLSPLPFANRVYVYVKWDGMLVCSKGLDGGRVFQCSCHNGWMLGVTDATKCTAALLAASVFALVVVCLTPSSSLSLHLSFCCQASLFVFGSHNKKRPHNVVLGRMYDGHVRDMVELGLESLRPMMLFPAEKNVLGSKPCLVRYPPFSLVSKYVMAYPIPPSPLLSSPLLAIFFPRSPLLWKTLSRLYFFSFLRVISELLSLVFLLLFDGGRWCFKFCRFTLCFEHSAPY